MLIIDTASPPLPADLCREALNASCDAIVAVLPNGVIDSFTPGFLRLTGGDASLGSLNRLLPRGFRPLDFYDGLSGKTVRRCTLRARTGPADAIIVYTRNVDCVMASIELLAADNLPSPLTAILEAAHSPILLLDGLGAVLRLNAAAQSLTGYSQNELAGRLFWEMPFIAEDAAAVRAQFDRLCCEGNVLLQYEARGRTKDGTVGRYSCSNRPAYDAGGRLEYVVVTIADEPREDFALASLSADFIDAQFAARRNVSAFLHDTVSQHLVVLALTLSKLQRVPDAADPFEAGPTLDLVSRCCRDLRLISYALAPPIFEDAEPAAAFEWYVGHLREDAGVDVEFHSGSDVGRISSPVRKLLLAAVQEWAEKTIRSEKVGNTQIRLSALDSQVRLELSSDQPGNDAVTAVAASRLIRERVRALGGVLKLESRQPGVSVSIVIAAA